MFRSLADPQFLAEIDPTNLAIFVRVDSFKESGGPALSAGGGQASSASEWAILTSNNDLALVNDEVNGVGLLKLGSSFGSKVFLSLLQGLSFAMALTFLRFM